MTYMFSPSQGALEIIVRLPQAILPFRELNAKQLRILLAGPCVPVALISLVVNKGSISSFFPFLILLGHRAQIPIRIHVCRKDQIASFLVEAEIRRGLAWNGANEAAGSVSFGMLCKIPVQCLQVDFKRVNFRVVFAFDYVCKGILGEPEGLATFVELWKSREIEFTAVTLMRTNRNLDSLSLGLKRNNEY